MHTPHLATTHKGLTMNPARRLAAFAIAIVAILLAPSTRSVEVAPPETPPDQLVGKTYRFERTYVISVHVPSGSVEKVLQALAVAVGLEYGKYDQVAYIDAEGMEQYRPLAGSKAGAQKSVTTTPSRVVTVSVVHDEAMLQRAVDAITRAHPYEEPVIYITDGWRSRSTSADDKNPNRWWNQKPN
jgi:hypothetical protein